MFTESFLTVNGCKIRLHRGGQGAPLLYLHGVNGAGSVQPFMELLAKKYDVLVPEHPGFGVSDEPDWLDNIHDLAYFYLDLLDQLGLDQVEVVGSSLGGWLAMEMAIREPSRFKALVLVGSAGIRIAESKPGDIFLWSAETAARNTFHHPEMVAKALSAPVDLDTSLKNRHTAAKLAWEPRLHDPMLHKWLHRLKMPVQLIWGDKDAVMPLPHGHALKKLIPQSELIILTECGHLPQLEAPQSFVDITTAFLEGASAQ